MKDVFIINGATGDYGAYEEILRGNARLSMDEVTNIQTEIREHVNKLGGVEANKTY
mgnify:CR=1 FL=1